MSQSDPEIERYAAWGYASAIPGLQMAVDTLQRELDAIRRRLGQLQEPKPKRGRPRKQQSLHPRDPEHPRHAQWLANVSRASRKRWSKMTAAEKKARQDAMLRGRKRAAGVRAIA